MAGTELFLELAQDAQPEHMRAEQDQSLVLLFAGLLGVLIALGQVLLHPLTSLRSGVSGSLAARIALSGAVSVAVAVGTIELGDARHEKSRLLQETGERLLAISRVGVEVLPTRLHEAVIADPDADSDAFLLLQHPLRRIQSAADLSSPVYPLRRDGEIVRFVGMTTEHSFIGDPSELRAGVQATLEGAPGAGKVPTATPTACG